MRSKNADVLEVIAEYACATVKDACALRAANKGHRRAVDTTVRRRVYEDQPGLRPASSSSPSASCDGAPRAVLQMHQQRTLCLHSVRLAFVADRFHNIARLVVTAFALDGAKDELHEADECGPRPVATSAVPLPTEVGMRFTANELRATWFSAATLPPCAAGLARCQQTAVANKNALEMDAFQRAVVDEAGAPGGFWSHVAALAVFIGTTSSSLSLGAPALQLLHAIGQQLTYLILDHASADMCPGIAKCTQLTHFSVGHCRPSDEAAVCDALIAGGSPLVCVDAAFTDAAVSLRLLEAVPSIVDVRIPSLHATAHSQRINALPLRFLNSPRLRLPCSEFIEIVSDAAEAWEPSACATSVSSAAPLRVADLATAYPRLRVISFSSIAADVAIEAIEFPATLAELVFDARGPAAASVLLRHVAASCEFLPCLTAIEVPVTAATGIVALASFAPTLSRLELISETNPYLEQTITDGEVAVIEATLAQLVGLETVVIEALPTARCFLGGRHLRLRRLTVRDADTDEAPLTALVRACPRLTFACSINGGSTGVVPAGWGWREMGSRMMLLGDGGGGLLTAAPTAFRDDQDNGY